MLNFFTSMASNAYAEHRENKARKGNFVYGELAADNADARTRALYNDLYSPAAQMKQLKEAGLSPSIYSNTGMAGKSGVAGAQGSAASGIGPSTEPFQAPSALELAQIRKLNAETREIEGETTPAKAKVDLMLSQAATELKKQGNYEAATTMLQLQAISLELTNDLDLATFEHKYQSIVAQSQIDIETAIKAAHESDITKLQLDYQNETYRTQVDLFMAQYQSVLTNTLLMQKDLKLKDEQIKQIQQSITQEWFKLKIYEKDSAAQREWLQKQAEDLLVKQGLVKEQNNIKKWDIGLRTFCDVLGTGLNTFVALRGQNIDMEKFAWQKQNQSNKGGGGIVRGLGDAFKNMDSEDKGKLIKLLISLITD